LLSVWRQGQVLLLDEPSAGLSDSETEQMISYPHLPGGRRSLCLYDMDVVFDLADRIIVLSYGVVLAEGSRDIQANPKVKEDIWEQKECQRYWKCMSFIPTTEKLTFCMGFPSS
jgi:branched-chain amino acid transport system ATP-binding protein